MTKGKEEAEKILTEYGRKMFDSHARYFSADNDTFGEHVYTYVSKGVIRRTAKHTLILCAALILLMSLTVVVSSALGFQLFDYNFNVKDGFTILTKKNEEEGSHFYKPQYTVPGYSFKEAFFTGDSIITYRYTNDADELSPEAEYSIDESTDKQSKVYIDNDGCDESKEMHREYELLIHDYRDSELIAVYFEKDGTFITITGNLSIEEVHSIIDSFVIDEDSR